jgi:hypothetical protein
MEGWGIVIQDPKVTSFLRSFSLSI